MIWVCLLRGINVSGKNLIRMESLRRAFDEMGFPEAETYVQSGNVIFDASKGKSALLARKIRERIEADFRCTVPVLVRSAAELSEIAAANPFLGERGIDATKLHVTFLDKPPTKQRLARLAEISAGDDRFRALGKELFLHCPTGYGRSKLANTAIERILGQPATTRSWKTVTALEALAARRSAR